MRRPGVAFPPPLVLAACQQATSRHLADAPHIVLLAPGVASLTISYEHVFYDSAGVAFTLAGVLTITTVHTNAGGKFLVGHRSTNRRPDG